MRRRGHTLIEVMLASVLTLILVGTAGELASAYARNWKRVSQHGITLQSTLVGLDRVRLEVSEAAEVTTPASGSESTMLVFRRPGPGMTKISTNYRDFVEVEYSLRPDGALWRRYVDLDGKIYWSPIAFDLKGFRCRRSGGRLDLRLTPREGPAMSATVALL